MNSVLIRFFQQVLLVLILSGLSVNLVFAKPEHTSQASGSGKIDSKEQIAKKNSLANTLTAYFATKVSDLDTTLFRNKDTLITNNEELAVFTDEKLLPLWSSTRTLQLILGGKRWKSLSPEQIARLENIFSDTFHRYIREGMKYYDGQRVKVLSVRLNKKLNYGLLTTELTPIYLPKFNIVFKIAKMEQSWQLYDILLEGISYVKMKKNEYRKIFIEEGFEALICHLDKKNRHDIPQSVAEACNTLGSGCKTPSSTCG